MSHKIINSVKGLSPLVCHFHRCDVLTWLSVKNWLERVLVKRVDACQSSFLVELDGFQFEVIRDFIQQMDCAYIHPRRDAMHVSLCSSVYADFVVPAAWLARRAGYSANPKGKKNLDQTTKH